jgi:hypothetical protein
MIHHCMLQACFADIFSTKNQSNARVRQKIMYPVLIDRSKVRVVVEFNRLVILHSAHILLSNRLEEKVKML